MTPFTEVDGTATARTAMTAEERPILHHIDGGIKTPEEELRYQLERKGRHPLARDERLIDVLADLEERGLITSALCFELTDRGRAALWSDRAPRTPPRGKAEGKNVPQRRVPAGSR